jgi:hypothetical protein
MNILEEISSKVEETKVSETHIIATEAVTEMAPQPEITDPRQVVGDPNNGEQAQMDDFEVHKLLGQGGYGIVQLVKCTNAEL